MRMENSPAVNCATMLGMTTARKAQTGRPIQRRSRKRLPRGRRRVYSASAKRICGI